MNKRAYFQRQLQIVYDYLYTHVATASMVSDATGIPQENVCRYKRYLEKRGLLRQVERKICKKTGYRAWYLTTSPKRKPPSTIPSQLKLFKHGTEISI